MTTLSNQCKENCNLAAGKQLPSPNASNPLWIPECIQSTLNPHKPMDFAAASSAFFQLTGPQPHILIPSSLGESAFSSQMQISVAIWVCTRWMLQTHASMNHHMWPPPTANHGQWWWGGSLCTLIDPCRRDDTSVLHLPASEMSTTKPRPLKIHWRSQNSCDGSVIHCWSTLSCSLVVKHAETKSAVLPARPTDIQNRKWNVTLTTHGQTWPHFQNSPVCQPLIIFCRAARRSYLHASPHSNTILLQHATLCWSVSLLPVLVPWYNRVEVICAKQMIWWGGGIP